MSGGVTPARCSPPHRSGRDAEGGWAGPRLQRIFGPATPPRFGWLAGSRWSLGVGIEQFCAKLSGRGMVDHDGTANDRR